MSEKPFEEQGLVLGDKINWAYILAQAVIALHNALLQEEGSQSEQKVREASLAVFNSIPTSWVKTDPQFAEDLKNCFDVVETDDRNIWCGKRVGSPKIRKEEKLNPWRLYHAAVDVFDRRNMLSKPVFTEILTGNKFQKSRGKKQ